MGWKTLFGGGKPPRDPAALTHAALDAYWSGIGMVERDVLGHFISPAFMGGPSWPTTRQAYRVVRRQGAILLATDGMADPFDDDGEPANGFGHELFIETPDVLPEHAGNVGDIGAIKHSWAFEILNTVARTVAGAGGIAPQLERLGLLSVELPGASGAAAISDQVPSRFIADDDSVGVLIGRPAPDFPTLVPGTPLSAVHAVPVVLMTAAELEKVREGGAAARAGLADALAATTGHRSCLTRADAI